MRLKIIPNRTISEKKKPSLNKAATGNLKSSDQIINIPIKEDRGTIPTKLQYDDDFDNWFPWEC